MSLRRYFYTFLFVHLVTAQPQEFDCRTTVDGLEYDLTSLAGEHTVSRIRETPPTTMEDVLRFDLCDDLSRLDGVTEQDQCADGTRACLTKLNKKDSESDRIVAVVPLAQTSVMNPQFQPLQCKSLSLNTPSGLSLILHGAEYPQTNPHAQSLNITFLCDTSQSDAQFVSYDGIVAHLEWRTPAGCSKTSSGGGDSPKDDDHTGGGSGDDSEGTDGGESVGSGLGWFFLLLLLAFIAYLALGAYYNYSKYGATGLDLIPHRDFWADVPYLIRDVVSHLCSSARPRHSSRSGYIAV